MTVLIKEIICQHLVQHFHFRGEETKSKEVNNLNLHNN